MQVEVANKESLQGAVIKISTEESFVAGEAEALESNAAAVDRANLYTSLGALLAAPATAEHLAVLRNLPEIEQPQSSMELAWTVLRRRLRTSASNKSTTNTTSFLSASGVAWWCLTAAGI